MTFLPVTDRDFFLSNLRGSLWGRCISLVAGDDVLANEHDAAVFAEHLLEIERIEERSEPS